MIKKFIEKHEHELCAAFITALTGYALYGLGRSSFIRDAYDAVNTYGKAEIKNGKIVVDNSKEHVNE